ncbi:hypothetical protein BUALT_Bualt06G0029100 [Buddleja alternifolia]|uniref:Uncharacterized protein n=1 Tax=Buddleja alternifolia TaxID=168488 RepID=A0AAV6XDN2_9LAMI|nr:hypothetical protein BUALT_Bualt06G0029100 [Buddleja alternifolia]
MSTTDISHPFSFLTIVSILLVLNDYCFCINSEAFNSSLAGSFSSAVATWYGSPIGSGSGGACGFANDVAYHPYNGLISAGNNNIFKSGKGCGTCYQVKCTQHPSCSGFPITVTITDECPGACNNEAFHFDLSGKAFGYLAKPGQADTLRNAGRINIMYQRVQCYHKATITLKIDTGSNPNYLAFAVENVNGDGDLGFVELLPSNSHQWLPMQQSWGATWKVGLPIGVHGPYTIRITTIESRQSLIANNVIPANWSPGTHYFSRVNIPT